MIIGLDSVCTRFKGTHTHTHSLFLTLSPLSLPPSLSWMCSLQVVHHSRSFLRGGNCSGICSHFTSFPRVTVLSWDSPICWLLLVTVFEVGILLETACVSIGYFLPPFRVGWRFEVTGIIYSRIFTLEGLLTDGGRWAGMPGIPSLHVALYSI